MTSQGSPSTRFQRSIQARNVFLAETAAFEMGTLSLEDALQLVGLYSEAEAHSVELVSQLRGPGAGWSAGALETLARQ